MSLALEVRPKLGIPEQSILYEMGGMTFGRIATIGVVGLAICWLPLMIVGGLGISNNPIGLGLFAVMGTPVVAALVAGLLIHRLVRWLVT